VEFKNFNNKNWQTVQFSTILFWIYAHPERHPVFWMSLSTIIPFYFEATQIGNISADATYNGCKQYSLHGIL